MSDFGTLGPPDAIVILPPLAIARLGGSEQPLECFGWGPSDLSAEGTAKTRIVPQKTLRFSGGHEVESYVPERILFKDEEGIRPVCPFFELHGIWGKGAERTSRPIDRSLVSADRLIWTISVANRKAEGLTSNPALAVTATLTAPASAAGWHELSGRCDSSAEQPLFDEAHAIPLGRIRVVRASEAFPEYRLRFYPAKGLFYGPSDLKSRWDIAIPDERLFINPASNWCQWNQRDHQARATPTGQYAADRQGVSYGLIDDVCDGTISCAIKGHPALSASARVVVAPPDFAPDRRPIVSLADGLKDREERHSVAAVESPEALALLEEEAIDIFERAFEGASLMNMDWIAEYFGQWNIDRAKALGIDYDPAIFFPFGPDRQGSGLPLSRAARRNHRRFVVAHLLRDTIRRTPDLIERIVRDPLARNAFNTRKMPALMRGADGRALHLTERQVALLKRYAAALTRASTGSASRP